MVFTVSKIHFALQPEKEKSVELLLVEHPDMLTMKIQLFSLEYISNHNVELWLMFLIEGNSISVI